ncbi:contactin-associated protein-like 4 isoform X1 [Gambusia affinis]|uniref:contactin-associated protein-like 4 isoform X1 n=2 Tax=Gambusia affinis TaxID=33528 RepID=UPI001CDCE038|nr:contactin-associated protein-like 4 isoform X1 [Gambusia affinis]XP_043990408.1 contactin-associated protein-like 4 isoform X1 [Gambusia affinis]
MDLRTIRVFGITARVALLLCGVSGTTAHEVCDSALVSNLPPSSFRSSSQLSSSHAPGFAKLNRRDGAGGWSPLSSDRYQWLEVDLGERTKITAVATQGRYGSSDWLTSYQLMFSDTGHNWKQYRQEDSIGSFPGNSNADSVVQYKLQQPAVARFLRLIPLDWNPAGRIGLRLEAYGCPYTSDVMSFDGGSSLTYRPGPVPSQGSKQVISLKFKTLRNSGTLLHAEGREGSGLSLQLERGKLQLLLREATSSSSDPRRLTFLGSLLDDQHWHLVILRQSNSQLNLTVDKHTQTVQTAEEFSLWDVKLLIVGASQNPGAARKNFQGCLENLMYNGVNVTELAKNNDHQVSIKGNVTFSCAEPVHVAATFPGPHSFLRLPWTMPPTSSGMSVGFQFRTWNKAGLLLTFDLPRQGGEVWLYLAEARLCLQIQRGGRVLLELSAGSGLNDGQWHSVDLTSRPGRLTVSVDKQETGVAHASPTFPVLVSNQIFFGGCPAEDYNQECKNPHDTFQGCMRLLALDNQPVDLIMVQQRLLGNYSQLQIDMCGIIDRCSPSHCEHGGLCSQTWTVFHCNCSDSGYSGATCHSSAYEQSCEAYKHSGNTSGYFYIDVDGSGPIKPQLVYCNMTDENTWMVVQHNNTELTKVRSSPGENQHLVHFDYMSEEEQLVAIIHQSEHCQQELSYQCRKSRLLNTQEGSPFSWWLGGPGTGLVQTYWGGAHPGSQQCACGLQGDCVDPQLYCNCDADRMEWSEDSGFISHKESLPVRSLVLGDVQRPGSEAAYRVGSLQCHGDKNFWNAAFFDQETSYLHFPTFHGELSADVSFFFKTTASFGVFLENLGIKDFIRIELSSSTQVVFSFDVGNGPLEVSIESSYPLNDDRWHRIQAERNVKEASLRLDDLPVATQEAPADGHIHLQLNSQLFIGGTASRQRGFRGCIRALQLNGVTLDLEERAKITPGVRPGCPGHCSSYGSLCQNQGRCVERAAGFHCDCTLSAYTGVFCQTEVSADFKSGTSISYAFKEPDELSRNSSDLPASIYSDPLPRGENFSLSFRTTQTPALLLHVSSHFNQYLALLINRHDELELRYKLDSGRAAEVLRSSMRGLANGLLHTVTIRRSADSVSMQIDANAREDFNLSSAGELGSLKFLVLGRVPDSDSLDPDLARLGALGFAGCLSVVRYNSVSPLKAALLHPDTSPVIVLGPLVRSNCGSSASANPYSAENTHHLSDQSGSVGSGQPLVNAMKSDSALIGGVIAVAIFVIVTVFAITARFLYRRKETYRSREVKAAKQEESQDFHYNNQTDGRKNASGENSKEFFM